MDKAYVKINNIISKKLGLFGGSVPPDGSDVGDNNDNQFRTYAERSPVTMLPSLITTLLPTLASKTILFIPTIVLFPIHAGP
ncbi:MAG: hypothetical protein WBZ20_09915 [Nitrososphaeraceae archaeon]